MSMIKQRLAGKGDRGMTMIKMVGGEVASSSSPPSTPILAVKCLPSLIILNKTDGRIGSSMEMAATIWLIRLVIIIDIIYAMSKLSEQSAMSETRERPPGKHPCEEMFFGEKPCDKQAFSLTLLYPLTLTAIRLI